LIVAGIVLAVVGAVVRFTTTVHSSGFNVHKVGDVLLAVGVVLVVVAAVIGARRRSATRR
jgi:lipoprotein signal peptidase